jgi:hydrogenase nickel incorporation protein HypB
MITRVAVVEKILSANERLAEENRACLDEHQVFGLNIMAAPGAGKTSTILQTIKALSSNTLEPQITIGVVEGDTAAVTIDADKVIAAGMPAVQINTGGECHLDAVMLSSALKELPLERIDLLIVENVGNLICPAAFTLGTHINVLISSVAEGDDKPYKYPGIYRGIDALIINKVDLIPYVEYDLDYFKRGVEMLNPGVTTFPISCRTGEGVDRWVEWLLGKVRREPKTP